MSDLGLFRPTQRAPLGDPLPLDPESRRQVPLRNWSRWAMSGFMHRSKTAHLFDHLVGDREQRRRDSETERRGRL